MLESEAQMGFISRHEAPEQCRLNDVTRASINTGVRSKTVDSDLGDLSL